MLDCDAPERFRASDGYVRALYSTRPESWTQAVDAPMSCCELHEQLHRAPRATIGNHESAESVTAGSVRGNTSIRAQRETPTNQDRSDNRSLPSAVLSIIWCLSVHVMCRRAACIRKNLCQYVSYRLGDIKFVPNRSQYSRFVARVPIWSRISRCARSTTWSRSLSPSLSAILLNATSASCFWLR